MKGLPVLWSLESSMNCSGQNIITCISSWNPMLPRQLEKLTEKRRSYQAYFQFADPSNWGTVDARRRLCELEVPLRKIWSDGQHNLDKYNAERQLRKTNKDLSKLSVYVNKNNLSSVAILFNTLKLIKNPKSKLLGLYLRVYCGKGG